MHTYYGMVGGCVFLHAHAPDAMDVAGTRSANLNHDERVVVGVVGYCLLAAAVQRNPNAQFKYWSHRR